MAARLARHIGKRQDDVGSEDQPHHYFRQWNEQCSVLDRYRQCLYFVYES